MKTLDRVVLYGGVGLAAILAALAAFHLNTHSARGASTESFSANAPPATDFSQTIYIIMGEDGANCYTFPPAERSSGSPVYPEFSSFKSPFVPDQVTWIVVGPNVTRIFDLKFSVSKPLQGIDSDSLTVDAKGKGPYNFYPIGDGQYKTGFTYTVSSNNKQCSQVGQDMGIHIDR